VTAVELRPYQEEAIDAVRAAYSSGIKHPAVVLPTGAGKTVIFAEIARSAAALGKARVLIVAHRDELISQAAKKIAAVTDVPVGIIKGARHEPWAPIVIASVQSLNNVRRRADLGSIDIVIIDEAHHAAAKTYVQLFEQWPDAFFVGFSATLQRTDGKALGEVWDKIVYTRDIGDMIEDGYLVPPRGIRVKVKDLHLENVRTNRGDFSEGQLGEEMSNALAPQLTAKAYIEHAADRSGILFAPTVNSAYEFAEALLEVGITTDVIHGGLKMDERRAILRRLTTGETQVACSCMVLTEGFDEPRVSCAVIARPTKSAPLYIQMVGRVLRLYPGKTDALILDVVGVTGRTKLATLADLIGSDDAREPKERPDIVEELEEERGVGEAEETIYAEGEAIEAFEIDLFGSSSKAWQKTAGGHWFLPTGKGYVFLWPSGDGHYFVCLAGRDRTDRLREESFRLRQAKYVGEGFSDALTRKAWRQDDAPATVKQLSLLDRWGIPHQDTVTKGEAAGLLDVYFASKAIDGLKVKG
jgi:superfamily II DNA or RNA helicase